MKLITLAACIALAACTDIDEEAVQSFKEACSGDAVSISAEMTTSRWGKSLTMRCDGKYGEYQ